jgi:hypothetical protein
MNSISEEESEEELRRKKEELKDKVGMEVSTKFQINRIQSVHKRLRKFDSK